MKYHWHDGDTILQGEELKNPSLWEDFLAAEKIVGFFESKGAIAMLTGPYVYSNPRRIDFVFQDGALLVKHRGNTVVVLHRDLAGLELEFIVWWSKTAAS